MLSSFSSLFTNIWCSSNLKQWAKKKCIHFGVCLDFFFGCLNGTTAQLCQQWLCNYWCPPKLKPTTFKTMMIIFGKTSRYNFNLNCITVGPESIKKLRVRFRNCILISAWLIFISLYSFILKAYHVFMPYQHSLFIFFYSIIIFTHRDTPSHQKIALFCWKILNLFSILCLSFFLLKIQNFSISTKKHQHYCTKIQTTKHFIWNFFI